MNIREKNSQIIGGLFRLFKLFKKGIEIIEMFQSDRAVWCPKTLALPEIKTAEIYTGKVIQQIVVSQLYLRDSYISGIVQL